MKTSHIIVSILFVIILMAACSVKPPEVRVTGEQTALEQEVIGTYQRIEEDTWMVASVRSHEKEKKTKISPEKKRVLDAMQTRKFNKDDIDEFKKKGYVGEDRTGFLVLKDISSIEDDTETMPLVQTVMQEENDSRSVIMERVISLNESLQKETRENVQSVFSNMYQEESPSGTWIQKEDGEWVKK